MKKLALLLLALLCGEARADNILISQPNGVNAILAASCTGTPSVCTMTVGGTITATLGGFTPSATGARGTPLTVTTSDSTGTLPTGAVVVVDNVGTTNPMYCNVNGIAATTSDQLITAGSWFAFTIPTAITTLRCIATGGSTTANMLGGSGLATGSGAGGSGGTSTGSSFGSAFPSTGNAPGFTDGTNMVAARVGDVNNVAAATNYQDVLAIGRYNATQPTLTDTRYNALQVSARGELLVAPGTSGFAINATIVGGLLSPGQAVMASSAPVVIASNQSAIPVTLTSTTITGTAAVTQSGTWTVQPGNTANTTAWLVNQASQYPSGAVPYTATATGTTGATTATLSGAASVTTYLCGFSIRANATAAATGNATVTGVITATLNFTQWTAPNASGLGITEMIFPQCIPASATNTSIAVVSAAPGTGGVVSVTAWGYKL